jgi:Mn-dependent DtxR family transcriptional regulator
MKEEMSQWEKEKKYNLVEAFARVMQGEPADGGNSKEETREYLLEFENDIKQEIAEKLERFGGFCTDCKDRFKDIITKKEF